MQNWIDLLSELKQKREAVALVTVTKCLGSTPCAVGSRMIVSREKKIYGTIGGGKLEFKAIDEAVKAIEENKTIETAYTLGPEFEQCCGGKVELIIEPMNQSPELFVFGAGHIGVKLSRLLKDTPFRVYLIDSRKDWFSGIKPGDHVETRAVDARDFKTFRDAVHWGNNCYVLVMTHDHTIDFEIIAMALQQQTKYLGLIGSETKRVRFHNMLVREMGIASGMDKVICPIGLETGGDAPKEIAISVAAQLLQVHYGELEKQ